MDTSLSSYLQSYVWNNTIYLEKDHSLNLDFIQRVKIYSPDAHVPEYLPDHVASLLSIPHYP